MARAVRDSNGRAYNRTAFLLERHKLMQEWADYLDRLRDGEKADPTPAVLPVPRAISPGSPSQSYSLPRGTREAQARIAISHWTRKMLVILRPVRRFGKVSIHNGEGSALSERSIVVVEIKSPFNVTPRLKG